MAAAAWEPHARLLAMHWNINRDPKTTGPAVVDDYNPFADRPPVVPKPIDWLSMRLAFVKPTRPCPTSASAAPNSSQPGSPPPTPTPS